MKNRYNFSRLGTVLTDADCTGEFKFEQCINDGDDLQYGITAMSELRFTIFDDNGISSSLLGESFLWHKERRVPNPPFAPYILAGNFTVESIRKTRSRTEVVAYDNMKKFDTFVDDWLANLTFPLTLGAMLSSLCTKCGVSLGTSVANITNSNFSIPTLTVSATNITGRAILAYICEVAASFAVIELNGVLHIRDYTDVNITLDETEYITMRHADYTVSRIDKVQAKSTEFDIGATAGTGDNIYTIMNNPLLYADTIAAIQTPVNNIYNKIHTLEYVPITFTAFDDFSMKCGDIITIDGMRTIIMNKRMTQAGYTFECTGNQRRKEQSDRVNQLLDRLHGSVHELYVDLDGLTSRVSNAEGSVATLSTRVAGAESNISLVVQNGQVNASVIVSAINGDSSVIINSNRISLTGKNINLTSDNITISSTYFNVDRYGNLTATNGTFTGTVNATGGRITGRLYLGSGSNFYISGNDTYMIYMYYNADRYFRVNNAGYAELAGATLTSMNIGSVIFVQPNTTTICGRMTVTTQHLAIIAGESPSLMATQLLLQSYNDVVVYAGGTIRMLSTGNNIQIGSSTTIIDCQGSRLINYRP